MVSRSSILHKTHYGLKIYAYVLRQFYPNATVLSLRGKDCGITHNPFNKDKKTLHIWIEDGIARHRDLELPKCAGDTFDFAKRYFQTTTEEALLRTICEALYLKMDKESPRDPLAWLKEEDSTWYTHISFFKAPVRNVFPSETLEIRHIYDRLMSDKYQKVTESLRAITDPKAKRKFKANHFDYVTFSGVFEKRNDKHLTKHSNLIVIDFDHLEDLEKTRKLLLQDQAFETELLFTSPSGDGLKWVIRIDLQQATHQEYFQAIANYINHTYQITVDASGKDVSRACFLCHDPNAYLHPKHQAL